MPTYTVLINIGVLAGLVATYLVSRRAGLKSIQVIDAYLAGSCGGLVAGRAVYVAANWDYYKQYPWRAARVWQGGLNWHGVFAGATLAILTYSAARRLPTVRFLAALSPGAAILTTFAWLACLATNQAYGQATFTTQTLLRRLRRELPDIYGTVLPRVTVQWLGVLWGIITVAWVLIFALNDNRQYLTFPLWLALQGSGLAVLTLLRADEVPMVGTWRYDTIANLALLAAGCTLCLYTRTKHCPKELRV